MGLKFPTSYQMHVMDLKNLSSLGVLDRTLDNLAAGWRRISSGNGQGLPKLRADLPDVDLRLIRRQIEDCLETRGGEASARARAAGLGHAYLELNDRGKYRFLKLIDDQFGVDQDALRKAIDDYLDEESPGAEQLEKMRRALRPPWIKLFTQFNALPSGVHFLVDMRADMVRFSREHGGLKAIDDDLKALLVSWFDVGFLDLKRLTWDEPASLLEKLITYEAVHEIQSWKDLKHRLGKDRCCYAFFHPRMPSEPLIFVQVALVNGITTSVHDLLDDDSAPAQDPGTADTAIFYSISNTQLGLRGVSLGDFLIKRVVDDLARLYPNIKTYATLSPIPGFRRFLDDYLERDDQPLTNQHENALLREAMDAGSHRELDDLASRQHPALRPLLQRLCAHYLVNEKRVLGAADSVANFHLTNGARIEQINWMGDHSTQGIERALGMMVNYLYRLPEIEGNHEEYVETGKIRHSSAIKGLLR